MPGVGGWIVAFCAFLFGYTTLIGWAYYGEQFLEYILGRKVTTPYRWIYCLLIPLGAISKVDVVWAWGDLMNALQVFPNLIGVLGLSGIVARVANDRLLPAARARRGTLSMARIVFTAWGSLGDLHPFLALAIEMQRRGHSATVATLGSWRDNVERAGVEFRPIRPDVSPDDPRTQGRSSATSSTRRAGPTTCSTMCSRRSIEATYADTVAAVEGADLLVSHQLPQTAPIVAAAHRDQVGVGESWRRLVFSRPTIRRRRLRRRQYSRLIALHPVVGRAFNQLARVDHESLDGAAVSASRTARAAARGPSAVRRAAFSGVCAGVVLGSVRRPTAGLPSRRR